MRASACTSAHGTARTRVHPSGREQTRELRPPPPPSPPMRAHPRVSVRRGTGPGGARGDVRPRTSAGSAPPPSAGPRRGRGLCVPGAEPPPSPPLAATVAERPKSGVFPPNSGGGGGPPAAARSAFCFGKSGNCAKSRDGCGGGGEVRFPESSFAPNLGIRVNSPIRTVQTPHSGGPVLCSAPLCEWKPQIPAKGFETKGRFAPNGKVWERELMERKRKKWAAGNAAVLLPGGSAGGGRGDYAFPFPLRR